MNVGGTGWPSSERAPSEASQNYKKKSWGCSVTSPASAFASRLRISCDSGCEITAMWLNKTTVKVPVHRREQGWFKMEYCINPQLHHNHDFIVWFVIVMKEKNMVLPLYLRKKRLRSTQMQQYSSFLWFCNSFLPKVCLSVISTAFPPESVIHRINVERLN